MPMALFPSYLAPLQSGMMARLARGVLAGLLIWGAVGAAPPTPAAAQERRPETPYAVAVLPFDDLRHPGREDWLGRYLRESIAKVILRSPRTAVASLEGAGLWGKKLGLGVEMGPTREQLAQMGVQAVLLGNTQVVLSLAELRIRVLGREGDLLSRSTLKMRIRLERDSPGSVLRRVMKVLGEVLATENSRPAPPPPESWPEVESLYTLLERIPTSGEKGARPRLISRLESWLDHPRLAGRAHQALALLNMEQAMLHLRKGRERHAGLNKALRHINAAMVSDPLDTNLQTLKGEIHFFRKNYFEAKTEASVARIKNPLNGLAFVVLGMVAGLSTGESTEHFKRAFSVNPFLRQSARPKGSPPFQAGILEPYFQQWEELRERSKFAEQPGYQDLLARGIAQFEKRNWEQAEEQLREAARQEENDFTPWLYLYRILIETDRAAEAVAPLKQLAEENPLQPEILLQLGIALERSGEPGPAGKIFHLLLREKPGDPEALFYLAATEAAEGKWKQARASLRALLHNQPRRVDAWMAMGIAQEKLGRPDSARDSYMEALKLDPGNTDAQDRLADLAKARRK